MRLPTPYVPDTPKLLDIDDLRRRIPGWGVDLDPADRPSVPQEWPPTPAPGVHWDAPERQPELVPRERSIEHEVLPAAFGTTLPPSGPAGAIRRYAFRYSEGRANHWLLLLFADRVDAWTSHLRSFASLRPDNPITGSGLRAEITHHGLRSRRGQKRTDVGHHLLDPVVVGGPWVLGGYVGWRVIRLVRGRRQG